MKKQWIDKNSLKDKETDCLIISPMRYRYVFQHHVIGTNCFGPIQQFCSLRGWRGGSTAEKSIKFCT